MFFSVVFIIKIAASLIIKYMYNHVVGNILFIQSFCILFSIPNSIYTVRLQKDLKFKQLSYANFLKDIITSIVKCMLAFFGMGPISVAYGEVFGRLFKSLFFFIKIESLPSIKI